VRVRRSGTVLHNFLLGAFVLGLGVSITLSETALACLTLHWLYRLATGQSPAHRWPLAAPFLVWSVVSLLAALLSGNPAGSLFVAGKGILLIATFYVVLDALDSVETAERFLSSFFFVMTGVSLVGLLEVAVCGRLATAWSPLTSVCHVTARTGRAVGFYSIYMTLAGVLSLVLLASLPRLLAPPASAARAGRVVAWLTGAAAFALTYVRGAWVGFVAGIAVLLGLLRRERRVLFVGIIGLVIAPLLLPGVLRRAETIVDPSDPTVRDRLYMWQSGLAMVRDHPLLGIGPGGVKREYPQYARPEAVQKHRGHLHNTPLQIVVERGVAGLAAWLAIWVAFFARVGGLLRRLPVGASRERQLTTGVLAAVAAFLIGGLTEYNFGSSAVVLVVYAFMALPFAAAQPEKSRSDLSVPPRVAPVNRA